MSKTAVGLFEHPDVVDQIVHDLDASAFPRDKIRIIGEPREMEGDGVTSTPRIDFEVDLNRELTAIGASDREADAYVHGVRRGGVLVLATGSNQQVDNAATIMNRHDAMELAELTGSRPETLSLPGEDVTPLLGGSPQTGRIRQSGGGARMFVW
jgi:hypothetical protein